VVKDKANAAIAQDASTGSTVAARWHGKVTRQLTKQNTMTVPYGVSKYGMKDQLIATFKKLREEGVDFGFEPTLEDAQYLSEVNWNAINDTVVAARLAMDWLQKAAQVVAANELPISWVTPSGLPVLQSYRVVLGKRYDFDVEGKRYRMMLKVEGDKLDRRKQSSGISPNFVHSLDAAHMVRTVCYGLEEGISSFAMIHDSFGTYACDADALQSSLRRSFVDQYSVDVLKDFRDQMVAGLTSELAEKIPPLPPMGNLELAGVLDSAYFFA
jgi:Mitochondrial DNA-directed RNA polymerase